MPAGGPNFSRTRSWFDIQGGPDIFEPMEIGRASGTMTRRERRTRERASATERNERGSSRALVGALLALIILSCAGGVDIRAQGPLPDPAVNMLFDDIQEYEKHMENRDNISFTPSRPRPGEKVEIKVRVFNAGKAKADEARVVLYDGKRKIGEKEIRNLRASKATTVEFEWGAKKGFHCFIAKIESDGDARPDNNRLLRVLIIGDGRKAHPYLFLYSREIAAWRRRVKEGKARDSWFGRVYGAVRTYAQADWSPDDYHETRGQTAHNAAVISILEDRRELSQKAVDILKSMANPGKVYESTKPGSWDDRQRICGLANYCMAYDLVASTLSEEDNKFIRRLLAKEIKHHYDYIRDPEVYGRYRGSFGYIITGFAIAALALAGYDDTGKRSPDYEKGGPSYGRGDEWLYFALCSIYLEFNKHGFQWDPSGYFLSGFGYLGQSESRCAAACWAAFDHVGFNLFQAYPFIERVHEYYLKVMLPNGWPPPTDDSGVLSSLANGMCVFSTLFTDKHARAVARWAWTERHIRERTGDWMDGHWCYIFLYRATPQDLAGKKHPPKWPPTMFFATHQVFRSDWSEDASYLMLNTKHCRGGHGHNQNDGCSIQYYAKRAYLIVDPGYGQGGAFHNRYVKPWCRGDTYNQSMILIDGKRPGPQWRNCYYPENRFSLDTLDYAESVAREILGWAGSTDEVHTGISHRRAVIFSRRSDYFVVIDKIRDADGETHKYE
ncbi:MAG: hypothetical protein DRN08_02190, partial [Thermoplasmata archaeon]